MTTHALPLPRRQTLARIFHRLPIGLYRLGLGRLLGRGFLLLTHTGRSSGQPRQAVLQVYHHAPATDTYYLIATQGTQADWVRNIAKTPEVTITVGGRHAPALAHGLPLAQAERVLLHAARHRPRLAQALLHRLQPDEVPTDEAYRDLARQVVVVAVRVITPAPAPAASPAPPAALAPPRGLLKFFFQLPNLYYRRRLGWLLGGVLLQVTHTGRKTGLPRQTVLQVLRYDKATDTYYVFAGWGEQSDWVRNIAQTPEVTLTVGRRQTPALAQVLPLAEAEHTLNDFIHKHPLYTRIIYRLCGLQVDGTPESYWALARQMGSCLVTFHPTPTPR